MTEESDFHPDSSSAHPIAQAVREGCFLVLAAGVAFLSLALASYSPDDPGHFSTSTHGQSDVSNLAGITGAFLAQFLLQLFGWLAWLIPVLLALPLFLRLLGHRLDFSALTAVWRVFGSLLLILSGCSLASLHVATDYLPASAGGIIGSHLSGYSVTLLGVVGGSLILTAICMIGFVLTTNLSWLMLIDRSGSLLIALLSQLVALTQKATRMATNVYSQLRFRLAFRRKAKNATKSLNPESQPAPLSQEEVSLAEPVAPSPPTAEDIELVQDKTPALVDEPSGDSSNKLPKAPAGGLTKSKSTKKPARMAALPEPTAQLPPVSLLTAPKPQDRRVDSPEDLTRMGQLLEQKLLDFRIKAEIVEAFPGPVVTRYELQPEAGVKASKITALATDLARSLAVSSLRVIEVIPGKTCVGIEIPNTHREIVRLAEIITSEEYRAISSGTVIALGKDVAGRPVCTDLARMPHLLIAGTTGSGKSVGVNAMLLSILFKSSPDQVRLILVDPKMLELSVYDGIPHLLTPVITDMPKASNALLWCINEMERRYSLMSDLGVRNLAGFNDKASQAIARGRPLKDPSSDFGDELKPLPVIVVVIDEFADMIMVVGRKVEDLIVRLAQKARAAGIHLVLATQRPSVDVITGLIKANIPGRISFQVSSRIDSRTILDAGGAEQLLGHGDMLFLPPGTSSSIRVHGAFVDDDEVHRVAERWRQQGSPDYISRIQTEEAGTGKADTLAPLENEDELYQEAVEFVLDSRRPTISSVQRKLRVGYNRAARLIDSMEVNGIISGADSAGNREILVLDDEKP